MNRFRKISVPITLFILVLMFATGCSASASGKRVEIKPDYFNTVSFIAAYAEEDELLGAAEEIGNAFEEIENAVNLSSDNSDISKFNNAIGGETIEISRVTYDLLNSALDLYAYTDGAYNPAVGRLVDLWGLSPRFNSNGYTPELPYDRASAALPDEKNIAAPDFLPDEKYISAFLMLTDFGDIITAKKGDTYYVTKPTANVTVDGTTYYMTIDLGGIAKGRAADVAAEILKKRGITQSYVSVGTSSLSLLESKRGNWTVTLRHPRNKAENYATVYANNISASTSGDYERYFTVEGKRYCHIVNPETGAPIDNGMTTVSLFGRSAEEGDAITTALACMGKDKAIGFINDKLTDCRINMVWYNESTGGYEFITNMEKDFELSDGNIELHSAAKDGKITYVA